jgi:hypothetical protein
VLAVTSAIAGAAVTVVASSVVRESPSTSTAPAFVEPLAEKRSDVMTTSPVQTVPREISLERPPDRPPIVESADLPVASPFAVAAKPRPVATKTRGAQEPAASPEPPTDPGSVAATDGSRTTNEDAATAVFSDEQRQKPTSRDALLNPF